MDSFGEFLRRERELRHIELNEIAKATRIKKTYLEAIETDTYDELQGILFVRGFIRSYCNYIGLDPDEAVNYFQQFYDKKSEESNQPAKNEFCNRAGRRIIYVAILIGFAAVGIIIITIYYSGSKKINKHLLITGTTKTQPVTHQTVKVTRTTIVPVTSTGVSFARTFTPHTLLLKATEDTWVRLIPAKDGSSVQEALLKSGEQVLWKFTGTTILTVGNAAGLNIILDKKEISHRRIHAEVIRLKLPH